MSDQIVIRSGLDRLRFTIMFEAILICLSTIAIMFILNRSLADSGILSVVLSVIAMIANYIYNLAYDHVDVYYGRIPTERSAKHRIYHAVGFELLLLSATIPMIMWWLQLSFLEALLMDVIAMGVIVLYTFLFGIAYDRAFPIEQPKKVAVST